MGLVCTAAVLKGWVVDGSDTVYILLLCSQCHCPFLANKVLSMPVAWSELYPGDSYEDLLAFDDASLLVSTVYSHVQLDHHQL